MSIGIMLIFGPLLAIVDIARIIPFIGKYISNGVGGVVKFILGLIGAAIWIVMFAVIYILNNIYLLITGLLLILAVAGWLWHKRTTRPIVPPTTPTT
jgi:hypothetical protein